MSEQICFVSQQSKLNDLRFRKKPIIAQFYTQWCPPCKATRMFLQKQLKDSSGMFTLASINCDQSDELNIQYEIEGVPTVIALNCDDTLTVFDRVMGYEPQKLKDFINKVKKEMRHEK